MATLDELRIEQLLSPFNKPQGIATLSQAASPLSFRYQDQIYPTYGTSNQYYPMGAPGTADDMVGTVAPGTADDLISTGFYATPDMNYPSAPANRLAGLNLDKFQGVGSFGIANEEDVEQVEYLPGQTKSIRDRVKDLALKGATGILGLINPALGFFARGLKGIGSLNDRIQQSDFGRSKTLKDYLQARRDRKAAEEAARRGSIKELQARIDRGDFGGGEGGGGGGFQGHGGYGTSAERGAALHG
jgi:hypothetical protein